jgi:hypothetical protein
MIREDVEGGPGGGPPGCCRVSEADLVSVKSGAVAPNPTIRWCPALTTAAGTSDVHHKRVFPILGSECRPKQGKGLVCTWHFYRLQLANPNCSSLQDCSLTAKHKSITSLPIGGYKCDTAISGFVFTM